ESSHDAALSAGGIHGVRSWLKGCDQVLPVRGPVERAGEQFCLLIPLDAGGREVIPLARRIARVEGGILRVEIPEWMMRFLNISEGSDVLVDIVNGKFNLGPADWKPGDPAREYPDSPQ